MDASSRAWRSRGSLAAAGVGWLTCRIHPLAARRGARQDELAALTVAIATDVLAGGGLSVWTGKNQDALTRARAAYAGLAGSVDVDVAMLTAGVQVLRDLCHALNARG